MPILAAGIGVCIVAVCIYFCLRPAAMEQLPATMLRGKKLYLVALLRIVSGSIFLTAADASRFPLAIEVLGWIAVTAGLLVLTFTPAALARIIRWYAHVPRWGLYVMMPLPLALGCFIVYSFT